jgi:hypothetical protein
VSIPTLTAGELLLDVSWHQGRIQSVAVTLQRPLVAVEQLLQQQPAQQACELLPMLFAVCGASHQLAGRLANGLLDLDEPDDQPLLRQALQLVALENLREYTVRLCRYWHYPAAASRLRATLRELTELQALVSSGQPLRWPPESVVLAFWQQEQDDWLQQLGTQLQPLQTIELPTLMPYWQVFAPGKPCNPAADFLYAGDGGACLLQSPPDSLVASLMAIAATLLANARQLLAWLQMPDAPLESLLARHFWSDDPGPVRQGWVRTSRGWLLHQIRGHEQNRQWNITAPTDVNFSGPLLPTLLTGLEVAGQLVESVCQWLLRGIDPCLDSRVRVHYGEAPNA